MAWPVWCTVPIFPLAGWGGEKYSTSNRSLSFLWQRRPGSGNAGPGRSGGSGGRPRCRTTGSRWRLPSIQEYGVSMAAAAASAPDAGGRDRDGGGGQCRRRRRSRSTHEEGIFRGAVALQDDGMVLASPAGPIVGPVSVLLIIPYLRPC
jgi:hypothetical protein